MWIIVGIVLLAAIIIIVLIVLIYVMRQRKTRQDNIILDYKKSEGIKVRHLKLRNMTIIFQHGCHNQGGRGGHFWQANFSITLFRQETTTFSLCLLAQHACP